MFFQHDIEEYLETARNNKLQSKYVLETHRQEDFVLGSDQIREITKAQIVSGKHRYSANSDIYLDDGEEFRVGELIFRAFTLQAAQTYLNPTRLQKMQEFYLIVFTSLSPKDFARECENGIVIDTRLPEVFVGGHIPKSFSIWLEGLPVFGGWVADDEISVILVLDRPEDLKNAFTHLQRIGVDNICGVLAGGCERDGEELDIICRLKGVHDAYYVKGTIHQALSEYVKKHSPLQYVRQKRALADDLPDHVCSQYGMLQKMWNLSGSYEGVKVPVKANP